VRIVFYCQFRHSLGHFARTRLIAEKALDAGAECAVLFGGRRPPGLQIDSRLEVISLPEWSGEVSFSPGSDSANVLMQRRDDIRQLLLERQPDRVLVDYLPLGLGGELMDSLLEGALSSEFIWGVPYPGREKKAPGNPRVRKALGRYSKALIYTTPEWLDPYETYRNYVFPDRVEHVGVVVAERPEPESGGVPPLVVGLAGAGIGAPGLFELMSEASLALVEQGTIRLRLVAGIYHQDASVIDRLREHPQVELWDAASAEDATRDADVVVSRCGYNTAFSLACSKLPIVFVPWASPDPAYTEQFDRAHALAELPGIWWLDERESGAVDTMRRYLEEAIRSGRVSRELPFETEGALRAAEALLR
jgi:predicted glycosyltransferase